MGWKRRNPRTESPPWIDLPRDMTANILRRLGPEEILDKAEIVCTTWQSVCREFEPSFWRVFDMKYFDNLRTNDLADRVRRRAVERSRRVCRRAVERRCSVCRRAVERSGRVCRLSVERSQGEVMEIKLKFFGTNDLLKFVSERCSSHLKIVRIQSCDSISIEGLTTAVKNLVGLEELHLFSMPYIDSIDIKEIGVSCPTLKSFTLHSCYPDRRFRSRDDDVGNRRTVSIAKNMPNLNRLCLFRDLYTTNTGLLAILDGCPNLVFLDLRKCLRVNLQSDIGRRCLEQIKELKRPGDGWEDGEEDEHKDPFLP